MELILYADNSWYCIVESFCMAVFIPSCQCNVIMQYFVIVQCFTYIKLNNKQELIWEWELLNGKDTIVPFILCCKRYSYEYSYEYVLPKFRNTFFR